MLVEIGVDLFLFDVLLTLPESGVVVGFLEVVVLLLVFADRIDVFVILSILQVLSFSSSLEEVYSMLGLVFLCWLLGFR